MRRIVVYSLRRRSRPWATRIRAEGGGPCSRYAASRSCSGAFQASGSLTTTTRRRPKNGSVSRRVTRSGSAISPARSTSRFRSRSSAGMRRSSRTASAWSMSRSSSPWRRYTCASGIGHAVSPAVNDRQHHAPCAPTPAPHRWPRSRPHGRQSGTPPPRRPGGPRVSRGGDARTDSWRPRR